MVICGFSVILFRERWVFQMVCCRYISRGALMTYISSDALTDRLCFHFQLNKFNPMGDTLASGMGK